MSRVRLLSPAPTQNHRLTCTNSVAQDTRCHRPIARLTAKSSAIASLRTLSTLLLAVGLGFAWIVPAITHEAPEGRFSASPADNAEWTAAQHLELPALDREAFPGCMTTRQWKRTHPAGLAGIPAAFVVVRLDGSIERMSTDETWERVPPKRSDNVDRADDVWPIGACDR